jgi:hypothetical protein
VPTRGLPAQPRHSARRVADLPLAPRPIDIDGGGTLDHFADNVRSFPLDVADGAVVVLIEDALSEDRTARLLGRLEEGLEHRLEFVSAKASIALFGSGAEPAEVVRTIGCYGLRHRGRGWGRGMTILTAVGSLVPVLAAQDRPLALFRGALRVCARSLTEVHT